MNFGDLINRAIVVIEDIDCSLPITGRRKGNHTHQIHDDNNDDPTEEAIRRAAGGGDEHKEESKVTLSGLLNFMDGLWSASGGERIFVFTTNHVEKIDEALIRRGRMDKHIEMSYCSFEAFKVLAKNYLNLDSHEECFQEIRCLLSEREISTADVAESLMPKSAEMAADESLGNLIEALKEAKKEETENGEDEDEKMGGEKEERENAGKTLKARIKRLIMAKI